MVPLRLRLIREINRTYTFFLKILKNVQPEGAKVFLFHEIVDNIDDVKSQFIITMDSFEKFLQYQLLLGYHPNNFEELSEIIIRREGRQINSFIVTFDDANESVYTKAYPFLKNNNIPFIVFITKELIGKPNFLTREQVIILSKDSHCTIGFSWMSS